MPLDLSERLIALLLAITANVHRDRKRQAKPYSAETFMPDPHAPTAPSLAEQRAAVMATLAGFEAARKART